MVQQLRNLRPWTAHTAMRPYNQPCLLMYYAFPIPSHCRWSTPAPISCYVGRYTFAKPSTGPSPTEPRFDFDRLLARESYGV